MISKYVKALNKGFGHEEISADLTSGQKLEVIHKLFELYYNTELDAEEFGVEFYYVTDLIYRDFLPKKLVLLSDFIDRLVADLPFLAAYYTEAN